MTDATEKDTWSAELYNTNASFVYSPQYTSAVLALLDAKKGETILDLGCGSGEMCVELQRVVGEDGLVVGTDFSASMVCACILDSRQIPLITTNRLGNAMRRA